MFITQHPIDRMKPWHFVLKLQKRITNLCRICGQSNPTDFFFVFWNYVHCHQNIQCIINTTPDILLVIIWRVQRLTIRFLEIIWMHLSQYFGDFSLHFVESYLFNQFISNLIVSGGPFFLHFFTNFHRKMTQPFAAAISVPSAPHKALYWLTVCRKNSRIFTIDHFFWHLNHLQLTLTFPFWCRANCLKYLSLSGLCVNLNHFQFVRCVRFDLDYLALVPSGKGISIN